MTGPRSRVEGDDEVLMLLHTSRSQLHQPLSRFVFVPINGVVYELLKAMYGHRDAGVSFDRKVLHVMILIGVTLGKFSICVGHRKAGDSLVRLVRLLKFHPPGADGGEQLELQADPRHVETLISQMGHWATRARQ